MSAPAPFDIDLKELDRQEPAPSAQSVKKKGQKVKKATAAAKAGREPKASAAENPGYLRYTVRPGDHIFKILIVRFGMSNEAAERLIPEVARVNHIANIKRLTVGESLLIPSKGQQERPARLAKRGRLTKERASQPAAILPTGETKPDAQDGAVSAQPGNAPVSVGFLPKVETPSAPAPEPLAAPVIISAPAVPPANTWICSVTEKDSARVIDSVLNALSVSWDKNRIVQSNPGALSAFSIRVDRYFEYKGERCIVSIGENDPYSYTLLRMLENVGYRVLRIGDSEDFKTVSEKLLSLIGVVPDFGRHVLQGSNDATGFLIQQDDAGGRRVLITGEPVDAGRKWVMARGCGALK